VAVWGVIVAPEGQGRAALQRRSLLHSRTVVQFMLSCDHFHVPGDVFVQMVRDEAARYRLLRKGDRQHPDQPQ
jgi:hypothetical protein